jgi:hypothetical protein
MIAGCASYVEGSGLTTLDHEVPYVRFIFGFMGDDGLQFPLRLVNKDFRLILDLARSEDAHVPAAEAAFQVNNSSLSRRFNGSRGKSPMIDRRVREILPKTSPNCACFWRPARSVTPDSHRPFYELDRSEQVYYIFW